MYDLQLCAGICICKCVSDSGFTHRRVLQIYQGSKLNEDGQLQTIKKGSRLHNSQMASLCGKYENRSGDFALLDLFFEQANDLEAA